MSVCRLPTCSIVGLNHSLVPSMLVYDVDKCVGVMHYEVGPYLPFQRRNLSGSIPADIASTSTLPCFSVYCRPPGFTDVCEPAVSKVLLQGDLLHERPAVYRHSRSIQRTADLAAKIHITRLLRVNASKRLEPFL